MLSDNPRLYNPEEPDDLQAMSYTIACMELSLDESRPDIGQFFQMNDYVQMIEIYVNRYEKFRQSHRKFINLRAYHDIEKQYPGMPPQHFHIIINTFISLYMTYKLTKYYESQADVDKIEECIWNVISQGFDKEYDFAEQLEQDIIQIKELDSY